MQCTSWMYIHTCVHVSIIYLESRHMTFFFHAYDLVVSTGPLKLPGCLSSAWPLKRRLRLRLRRWGFFSLSSVIAKFTMKLFWQIKCKKQSKKKKFLAFKDLRGKNFLIKQEDKTIHAIHRKNTFVVLNIPTRSTDGIIIQKLRGFLTLDKQTLRLNLSFRNKIFLSNRV